MYFIYVFSNWCVQHQDNTRIGHSATLFRCQEQVALGPFRCGIILQAINALHQNSSLATRDSNFVVYSVIHASHRNMLKFVLRSGIS